MPGNRVLLAAFAVVVLLAAMAGMLLLLNDPVPPAQQAAVSPEPAVPGASAPDNGPGKGGTEGFVRLDPAPDFTALAPLDPAGQPADMAPYRGKALLVNFWATWCAPCIKELPSLAKLQERLGGTGFAVLTVALDEPYPAKVAAFLAEHGAGGLTSLIDGNRTVDKVLPIAALPTSILVDGEGKVRAAFTGDATWHCGKALEAVQAFVKDGTVAQGELLACEQ